MKCRALWLLLLFIHLYVVTSSIHTPQMAGEPLPSNSTDNKFIYKEVPKVNVTCSLPLTTIPDDVELELIPVEDLLNPVANGQLPKYTRHNNNTMLGIEYPSGVFLGCINVTCYVRNTITKEVLSSSEIQIEQLYETMNARIAGYANQKIVEPGEEVTLLCVGDGNPRPNRYQWYNRTTDADETLENQTQPILKLSAPTKWSGQSSVVCGVANELRKPLLRTGPITVISIYIPEPIILSTPTASVESTADHLVFMEVPNISLTCCLPLAVVPPDVALVVKHEQYELNPVYPSELANVTQNKTRLEIQYNPNRFIGIIKVECNAVNRTTGETKSSSLIQIDQQYKTQNVKLNYSGESVVEADEEVLMSCQGDGHSEPQEYEWFNRTKGLDVPMDHNSSILHFLAPEKWSGQSVIVCGTRNEYNTEVIVKSDPVTVSSVAVPPPIIDATPTPSIANTVSKVTYLETAKVTVKCSLPVSTPEGVVLRLYVVQPPPGNPVFPDEKVQLKYSEGQRDTQVEVGYNQERVVPLVLATCAAVSLTSSRQKSSATIQIEQQCKTNNVMILENSTEEVEPRRKVTLKCLADGNPLPEYQWFVRTEAGDVPLPDGTHATYQLTAPGERPGPWAMVCGARNQHNMNGAIKSEPVTVSDSVPSPTTACQPPRDAAVSNAISWAVLVAVVLIGVCIR